MPMAGLLLARGLALAAASVATVTFVDELVLVRAGIAALALALLKLVAGLVLLACVVGVTTAAVLDESGRGSLQLLLDVVSFFPAGDPALDFVEREG